MATSKRKLMQMAREGERVSGNQSVQCRQVFPGNRPSSCIPRDVRAMAHEIEAARYNCSPMTFRELERARTLLVKGMPTGVMTDRNGFSTIPVFAGQGSKIAPPM